MSVVSPDIDRPPLLHVLIGLSLSFVRWLRTEFAALLDAEQGRWFLWLPVFFGSGIGIYFAFPFEPELTFALGALICALILRIIYRVELWSFLATSIILAIVAGFAIAKLRTDIVSAPILDRRGAYDIEGFVESFDKQSAKRARTVIRIVSLKWETQDAEKKPFRVRIGIRGEVNLTPGSYVKLRAILQPPPEPVMPGGFDYARMTYYQAIGASGYALSRPEIIPDKTLPFDLQFRSRLAALRMAIADRITSHLPGQTGAVAAALSVGQEAGLNEQAMDDLRGSGLAHIISISGLHMSLVAGFVYWIMRWVLAWFPSLALRIPVRAYAGGAALICVTIYLALSGASVAAIRSYIMILVVFLAILFNRPALSLRNVALSALLILVVLPDSLIDISFQMSYAATAALIAGYERFGRYLHFEAQSISERLIWQPIYFIGAVFVTTATAGLAVEPFSAYHFHNLTSFAAIGNLLGGPPIDFLVMPAMILALIAMPFGYEDWPLTIMGYGIDAMMAIAHQVSALPHALVIVPAFPFAALFLMIWGGLWLMIWRQRWRLFGLIGIGAGLALTAIHDKPDIFIDREAKVVAIRDQTGKLQAPKSRKGYYALGQWLRADGDDRKAKDASTGVGFHCDAGSCLVMTKGFLLSHIAKLDNVVDDCARAAMIVTALDIKQSCSSPQLVLDRGYLWEKGAGVAYITDKGVKTVFVQDLRGERPWSPLHRRREKIAPVSEQGEEMPKTSLLPDTGEFDQQ